MWCRVLADFSHEGVWGIGQLSDLPGPHSQQRWSQDRKQSPLYPEPPSPCGACPLLGLQPLSCSLHPSCWLPSTPTLLSFILTLQETYQCPGFRSTDSHQGSRAPDPVCRAANGHQLEWENVFLLAFKLFFSYK